MAQLKEIVFGNRGRLAAVILTAVLGASLLVIASSRLGPGPLSTTCTFTLAAGTRTLTSDCTTNTTILVGNGETLDGAGHLITANDPAGGHFVGGIISNAGSVAHVQNLRVTAYGLADVCDGGADRLRGILFDGASGSILNNEVTNINQGASGCQEGNGIEVRNAPFDGSHPNPLQVTIADNVVTGYQKTGILANGDVFAEITGNTVVGAGPVPYIAQNGIQVGFGATGEVRGNDISGNEYTGCSKTDARETGCTPWVSTALLLYDVDANTVRRSDNSFRDNQQNLVMVTSESLAHP